MARNHSRVFLSTVAAALLPLLIALASACGDDGSTDAGEDAATPGDGGVSDSGASPDGGGTEDGGTLPDGAVPDAAVPDDGLHPVLSNFRVEDGERDRLYFDSSEPITASDTTGFTVSGATVTGVHAEGRRLTGHYLIVEDAFDFWDNTTIRYDGMGDLRDFEGNALYEFTLRYVDNLIPEPPATDREFYVDASVSSSGDGSSEAQAFKTLREGFDAIASESSPEGTTLWVRAGNYDDESITMATDGTAAKPIKIIGYRTTPGDITEMYWSYGKTNPLVASEMPLLDGDLSVERAIRLDGDYVIYRNLQARDYYRTFVSEGSPEGVLVDNCLVNNTFGTHGNGIGFKGLTATRNRITRSTVVNASILNFAVRGSFSLVEGCRSYGDDSGNATDYYMDIKGSHNIVRECLLDRVEHTGHPGHGLSLKGRAADNSETAVWPSEYTLFERCEVRNIRLAIHFGHKEVRHNVVRDITITGDDSISENGSGGIIVMNSAYNLFERIFVDTDGGYAIRFGATTEDRISEHGANNNVIRNSVFRGAGISIGFSGDGDPAQERDSFDNRVENSTFIDNAYLEANPEPRSYPGNEFINCIFEGTGRRLSANGNPSSLSFTYTNFHDSGFPPEAGEGNLSEDPLFDTASENPFTPHDEALRTADPLSAVNYDFDDRERRASTPTIGACEMP